MNLPKYKQNIENRLGTPCDFCFDINGVLTSEFLTKEGFLFTKEFYDSKYIDIFNELFSNEDSIDNSWENYSKIEEKLNSEFRL